MTSVNDIKAGYWLEKQAAAFPVEKIAKTSNYNYLFFGFAALHPSEYTIDLTSEQQIMLTNFVKSCHSNCQNINAILSIGGPGDGGDNNTAAKRFSEMAGSKQNRNKFVNSVIATAVKYRLDGLDLAWESRPSPPTTCPTSGNSSQRCVLPSTHRRSPTSCSQPLSITCRRSSSGEGS